MSRAMKLEGHEILMCRAVKSEGREILCGAKEFTVTSNGEQNSILYQDGLPCQCLIMQL